MKLEDITIDDMPTDTMVGVIKPIGLMPTNNDE